MAPSFLGSANKALQNYYTPILIIILLALFGYLWICSFIIKL